MKTTNAFLLGADRYLFDFKVCTAREGFAQVDTSQDASYFGTWASPKKLKIITYAEGDLTIQTAGSTEEFCKAVRALVAFHEKNGKFHGIDSMCNEVVEQEFIEIGLGDLLH